MSLDAFIAPLFALGGALLGAAWERVTSPACPAPRPPARANNRKVTP